MKLTVAELFAGVGGFRVGLNNIKKVDSNGTAIEQGDWKFVWANQYEPSTKVQHAFECYKKRFGNNDCSNEDIHEVSKKDIPDHSLLVGGFPCQDYSVARSLYQEKGIEGKKGVLFWDIKDVLLSKNTPFVLLENVDRLLKSPAAKRGRDFAIMLKTFDDLDYDVQWRVINAGEYAMPQKRRRVFIFAYKRILKYAVGKYKSNINLNNDNIFNSVFDVENIERTSHINLRVYKDIVDISDNYYQGKFFETGIMIDGEVIHSNVNAKVEPVFSLGNIIRNAKEYNYNLNQYIVDNDKLEKWQYLKGAKKIERISKNGHSYIYSEGAMSFPENMEEPARTMLTSEGTLNRSSHIIFDEYLNKYRILTPIECEMIQMFPPNWTDTMPTKSRYFMMGNALVTGIISRLEPLLKEIVINE